ncbi:MAG: Do family serine endopeptidase [Bacteroidales bacterium]|jgi:Do/DeqQ family serine protease|nr:Do family serine endopeptidase [Bacteroidales bacterium]
MKTKQMLGLLGAMFLVSGLTATMTYKVMEKRTVQELADGLAANDSNSHLVQFTPTVSRGSVTDNDFTQAAEKTVNAVVGVRNRQMVQQQQYQSMDPFFDFFFGNRGYGQQQPQQKAREGYGSGVIISADGYIVTNNHVIANADQLTVTLNDQREFEATLVGTDPTTDIALLKVDAKDLPTIAFGESDNLKVGEWVLAVGNPFMLTSTVTAGIVSAKARQIGMGQRSSGNQMNIESFIQTDAAVNPGNSGGALVNTAGELVGINTAIYSETGNYAGYSFAVPSSIVNKVVADLRQYGQVQRAVLGIRIQEINPELVEKEELKESEGIYVAEVMDNGAAADAGIKKGDVITSIDKVRIKNFGVLQGELARHTPGEKVQVTVDRKGKNETFTVTLKNSDGNTEMRTKKGIDALGVKFENLSAKDLQKYGVRKGVLVKSVEQGGAFARAGVHEKFVIVKINDVVVSSDKEIEKVYNDLTTSRSADQDPVMFIVGVYPNGRAAYYAVDLSK